MLSEPRWRKRMQLHEQDPGLRQATVCFRSLWGPAWKGESGGVAWQTFSSSLFFFTVLSLQKEYSPPPPLPCFFYLLSDPQHKHTQRYSAAIFKGLPGKKRNNKQCLRKKKACMLLKMGLWINFYHLLIHKVVFLFRVAAQKFSSLVLMICTYLFLLITLSGKDLSSRSETDLNCIFGKRARSAKVQDQVRDYTYLHHSELEKSFFETSIS